MVFPRTMPTALRNSMAAATSAIPHPTRASRRNSSLLCRASISSGSAFVPRRKHQASSPGLRSISSKTKEPSTRIPSPSISATAVPAGDAKREIWEPKTTLEAYPYSALIGGVASLFAAEKATAAALKAVGSSLPSPVVLLGVIGAFMALGGKTATEVYDWMHPAIAFFDQWMPLFFVPSISAIALAPLPQGVNLLKSIALLGLSYLFALYSTAKIGALVGTQLKILGLSAKSSTSEQLSDSEKMARIKDAAKNWTKQAAQAGAKALASAALKSEDKDTRRLAVTGASALNQLADSMPAPSRAHGTPTIPGYSETAHYVVALALLLPAVLGGQPTPLTVGPGLFLLSIALFNSAKRIPASIRMWAGPTLAGGLGMTAIMAAFGVYSGGTWQSGIRLYSQGAGALLANLIGPAVAALGFKVYSQRALLQQNAGDLVLTCLLMAPIQFLGTALIGRLLGAPQLVVSSLLPAHTTLGMALPMAPLLLASPGLIVAGVTIAGTTGISTARSLLDVWGVRDATTRGLAVGVASHSLGTSALVAEEPRSAAVSGLAFALKGCIAVVMVSIPAFRKALLFVATGRAL